MGRRASTGVCGLAMLQVAAAIALCAGTVSAAVPSAVIEVEHDIEVEFHATHATVTVRRTLETEHLNPFEVHLTVDAGHPAAATALATQGGDGHWYRAELMDVHDAVDTYWALTGSKKVVPEGELPNRMPGLKPKDPALLMWRAEALSLFVFPLADGERRSVEYTLQVPYEHEAGADVLYVPVGGVDDMPPEVTFGKTPKNTRVTAEGETVAAGRSLVPTSASELAVRIASVRSPTLSVSLASIPAAERQMVRAEVTAGRELGEDPTGTHAIVVLDRSRSLGEASFAAGQAAVQAYLRGLGDVADTKVQILGFARETQALQEGFVSPLAAAADLRDAGWDQRNGSDLGAALRLAAQRLGDAPRGVPRRVLVVSDAVLTDAVEADALAQIQSLSAVVHLADIEGARWTALNPAQSHRWDEHVLATGGLVWRGAVDAVDATEGKSDDTFAPWIRPQRIRELHVSLDAEELGTTWLEAGEGVREVELYERPPQEVVATGRLWGQTVTARATRTTRGDRAWGATAAAYLGGGMSEAEIVDVAHRAGAVSPHTALLALEPHARPGEATPPTQSRPPRMVRSCVMRRGGGSSGEFGRYSLAFDEPAYIHDQVNAATKSCNATHARVAVELTTTYAEIVSVDRVEVVGHPKLAACIEEALWNVEFPPGEHRRATHSIRLGE